MRFPRSTIALSLATLIGLSAPSTHAGAAAQFTASSSGATRAMQIVANITPDPADIGRPANLYLAGVKDGMLYFKEGSNGSWVPYQAGKAATVFSATPALTPSSLLAFNGDDLTQVLGGQIYVGYGSNEQDMLSNKKFSLVHQVQGLRSSSPKAKNVIFFLGDGYGIPVMTAARIYAVGEDGNLTIDTLPESAFIRTFSNDSQVTDSAPSMSAYMTGVKMNNEVLSMTPDTLYQGKTGAAVTTFLELAKGVGMGTGVVTTTRVTHATPAATYSHINDRDKENDIAAQLVPGGAQFNPLLKDGLDVVFGGGCAFFVPTTDKCSGSAGKRTDGRNLVNELQAKGYALANDKHSFDAIPASTKKAAALFTSSHMTYDLDRDASKEPSLAEMTTKAIDILAQNGNGYFLMVEGGRIDHALHETNAARALQDAKAFDNAIKAAIDKVKLSDPTLANTLIVVTADHDHTMVLNGYTKRTGATTASNPGILGLAKSYVDGTPLLDADKMPYSILGFGNGENRAQGKRSAFTTLSDAITGDKNYHQEAVVRMPAGSETHGGTDVFLGAIGAGADLFSGFMDNTQVFKILRDASGI